MSLARICEEAFEVRAAILRDWRGPGWKKEKRPQLSLGVQNGQERGRAIQRVIVEDDGLLSSIFKEVGDLQSLNARLAIVARLGHGLLRGLSRPKQLALMIQSRNLADIRALATSAYHHFLFTVAVEVCHLGPH